MCVCMCVPSLTEVLVVCRQVCLCVGARGRARERETERARVCVRVCACICEERVCVCLQSLRETCKVSPYTKETPYLSRVRCQKHLRYCLWHLPQQRKVYIKETPYLSRVRSLHLRYCLWPLPQQRKVYTTETPYLSRAGSLHLRYSLWHLSRVRSLHVSDIFALYLTCLWKSLLCTLHIFVPDMSLYLQRHISVPYKDRYFVPYMSLYGVATMSRMLNNICLFAEYRSLL